MTSLYKCTCLKTRGKEPCMFAAFKMQYELHLSTMDDTTYQQHMQFNCAISHNCICAYKSEGVKCLANSGMHNCMCKHDPASCLLDVKYSTTDHDCVCSKILQSKTEHSMFLHSFYDETLRRKIAANPKFLSTIKCRTSRFHHHCMCPHISITEKHLFPHCNAESHHCSCHVTGFSLCRVTRKWEDHMCICHTGNLCHAHIDNHMCVCNITNLPCLSKKHECLCNTKYTCHADINSHKCICNNDADIPCLSNRHYCICDFETSKTCLGDGHDCICDRYTDDACLADNHDCVCDLDILKACLSRVHYCR